MRPRWIAVVLFALLPSALFAARQRVAITPGHEPPRVAPADVFTYSEPDRIRVTHLSLDLTVDFDQERLSGTATLVLLNPSGSNELVLDTSLLTIVSITRDDGTPAPFTLAPETAHGARLAVDVLPSTQSITIRYQTHANAAALFWNHAAQSYGRQQPYLYSQNEPDYARSWIPIQDTPATRLTYDATIHVPPGMLALMSAANPIAANDTGVYHFRMDQSIPPYLIALGVGRLEFRSIGARTGVYAEPELIEDAKNDLSYMETMLEAAERVAGPYPWGRWDVLLMPPTYIAGGMEHPRLNFINPFSVVTLDRPATPLPTSLMAHELAHSWAGDATTLATWSDGWLNEGITSYLTVRILEELSGSARANYTLFNDRQSFAGYASNATDPDATRLHRGFDANESADLAFGAASYLKGELFLHTMESILGRPTFDTFLRGWFADHSFEWVDDVTFLADLQKNVFATHAELESKLRALEWVYDPGLPSNVAAPTTSTLYAAVNAQAQAFAGGRKASQLATAGWTTVELSLFLNLSRSTVGTHMADVDAAFGMSSRNSPPTTWLELVIEKNYAPGQAGVDRVLMRGGTNSTIMALYAALAKANITRARQMFDVAGSRYSSSVQRYIQTLLKISPTSNGVTLPVSRGTHAHLAEEIR
jgi:leukotriene-A4 hydrolase